MKKQDILKIVDELIELEPSLKRHRKELEKHVELIVQAKPSVSITPAFKQKLLTDLKKQIATSSTSLSPQTFMQKFMYAIGGAVVASIGLYVTVIHPVVPPAPLTEDGNSAELPTMHQEMVSMNARPQSGGGSDYAVGRGGGGGGVPMMDSKMIAPGEPYPMYSVEYVYDGDITLPDPSALQGYKRTPLKSGSKAELLKGTFVEGLMNIDALKSLSVINVSLSEGGDEPLMVNVDFNEGYISLNRQIDYNKRPESSCKDEACYERYRLKERDMLSDERTIELANEFLNKLGVNMSAYGEPIMQNDWRMWLEREVDPANYYFPEQLSVIYPYLVNGNPVFDEWGNPSGLSVNVDVRLRAAIGLWGLRTMNTVKETIEPVKDPELVREVLRTGGANGYLPEDADLLQAKLGVPDLVYVTQYNWDEEDMIGYEVYVPALYFPVTMMPKESYEFRKAVVIPLSADMLQVPENMPRPMPLPVEPMMEGAAG